MSALSLAHCKLLLTDCAPILFISVSGHWGSRKETGKTQAASLAQSFIQWPENPGWTDRGEFPRLPDRSLLSLLFTCSSSALLRYIVTLKIVSTSCVQPEQSFWFSSWQKAWIRTQFVLLSGFLQEVKVIFAGTDMSLLFHRTQWEVQCASLVQQRNVLLKSSSVRSENLYCPTSNDSLNTDGLKKMCWMKWGSSVSHVKWILHLMWKSSFGNDLFLVPHLLLIWAYFWFKCRL